MKQAATITSSFCFFLIALFLFLLGGCHSQSLEIGEYPVVINGKEVAVHPEKVVSLSPACTAYALMKGYDTGARADISGYPDASDVNEFAQDAVKWAVACGMIQGDNGYLNPQGYANRAECATIIQRFIEAFEN